MSAEAMAMLGQATQGGANPIEQFMPLVSEVYNWYKIKEQRRYNESQIDKQWQRQLDQWNRENTYNDPRQVIARMRDAGVNPALAYMNGASFAPAANSPSAGANHGQPIPLDPLTAANVDLAAAQARDLNASADVKEQKLPQELQILNQTLDNMKKTADEINARIANMDFDNKVKAAQAVSIEKTWQMHQKEIDAKVGEIRASARYLNSLSDLNDREIWERLMTWSYRLAGFDLQNKEISSRIGLNSALTSTEWFKQVNLQSQTNLNGLRYNLDVMDGVLKTFDINSRSVDNRANLTDMDVMQNAFAGGIYYGLHVIEKTLGKVVPDFIKISIK